MKVLSRFGFGYLAGLMAFLFLPSSPSVAQNGPLQHSGPCDTARAIGHLKRIVGTSSHVTIERAGGGVIRRPAPLTPICAADRLKVRDTSQAVIDVHNGPPVTVTRSATWTAPTVNRSTNLRSNVWAYFIDKLAPDVGRVQVQNRTRGPASGPPKVLLAGISTNLAQVSLADLGPDLVVPIAGWQSIETVQLASLGPQSGSLEGRIVGLDGSQIQQAPVMAFPASQLRAGRYVIKVRLMADATEPGGSRERVIGGFEVIEGKAPTLQTDPTDTPYDPATLIALQALWLAQSKPQENGLMAFQIAQRGGSDILPSQIVQRLVLSFSQNRP